MTLAPIRSLPTNSQLTNPPQETWLRTDNPYESIHFGKSAVGLTYSHTVRNWQTAKQNNQRAPALGPEADAKVPLLHPGGLAGRLRPSETVTIYLSIYHSPNRSLFTIMDQD